MEQDMRYVYEVYRAGSFSKAAERLDMTQPALSMSVRRTEESIGMPLFDRRKHPLSLTEAGQIYLEGIEAIRQTEENLKRHLEDLRDLEKGSIVIGGSHYVNSYIFPPVVKGYHDRYPGIEVTLVEDSAAALARMLCEKEIDLTFSCDEGFAADFERYRAFKDTVLLAVSERNPLNRDLAGCRLSGADILEKRHLSESCPTVSLKAFAEQPFILLTKGNNLHDRAEAFFREAGIRPRVSLTLSQLATAYSFAAEDYGVTFVSDRMVRHPETGLFFYKLDSKQAHRQFYCLLPDRDYTPLSVRAFIRYFRGIITGRESAAV